MVKNPNAMVAYFKGLHKQYRQQKGQVGQVVISMKEIVELTPDALFTLQSLLCNQNFHLNQPIRGDFPINETFKEIMNDSGFVEMLQNDLAEYQSSRMGARVIHESSMKADPKIAERIIRDAYLKLGLGEPTNMQYDSSYTIILELMANVTEHAGREKLSHPWFLFAFTNKHDQYVEFTFLDHGIGVIDSLKKELFGDIKYWFAPDKRVDLLTSMFKGEMHRTHSGLAYRGKGLPKIYNKYKVAGDISHLAVLTQNVFLDFHHGNRLLLNSSFAGTAYYWRQQWKQHI
jgi:hypothetical protein